MRFTGGERVRIVRELLGFTRDEFADMLNLDSLRLKSIELGKARVSEMEYQPMGLAMPELLPWLVYEKNISIAELEQSESKYCKLIAGNLAINKLPKNFKLVDKIDA